VRDRVSYSYKRTGKIIVLYISIFTFWERRQKNKSFWNVVNIPRIWAVLNFFMTVVFICSCHSQRFELCHISKVSLAAFILRCCLLPDDEISTYS
jgi:hypothetical protein